MATERPVTGSCERCARGHELLIPKPGSGDLDFQRIRARFNWCAGCGRVVGRTCCWDGASGLCPDCAGLRAAPEASLTDAVLIRNALSGISAATVSMGAIERRLRRLRVTDENKAGNAWEDAWLDAGILIVRADGGLETARRRGAAASASPDDGEWLTDQLSTLQAAWDERNRAVADRLERLGLRIHALGALALPAATVAQPPSERELVPIAVTRTVSPVTHLPAREPALVGARPSAPARPRPSARPPVAPWAPARQGPPAQPAPAVRRVQPAPRTVPVQWPAPPPRAQPPARPIPGRSTLPRPAPGWQAQRVRQVPTRPAVAPQPEPQPSPEARRGGRRLVILLVALLTVVGAMVAAAAIDRISGAAEPSSRGATSSGRSDSGAGTAPSPSADATIAGAPPGASGTAVTFDLEPLGPLSAEAAGIARVLGAPEVAALPTPFDRSLRLATQGNGACLEGVPGEPARSLAIDLRTGTRTGASLQITPTDRPGRSVALELARIAGLQPETWYRIQLGWADDGAISVEVREREDGRAVHQGQLAAATDGPDRGGPGSVCFEALRVSEASAMHIDNARVGT